MSNIHIYHICNINVYLQLVPINLFNEKYQIFIFIIYVTYMCIYLPTTAMPPTCRKYLGFVALSFESAWIATHDRKTVALIYNF